MFLGVTLSLLYLLVGIVVFSGCGYLCFSLEVGGLGFYSLGLDFVLFIDYLSCVFFFMLLCCGPVALYYCCHYYKFSSSCYGLVGLMSFFLSVMVFLVLTGGLLITLVFWEFLGLISFVLILYYANMGSLRASVVTLVSSRVGDVGLFVFFCAVNELMDLSGLFLALCVFFIVCSKSAGFPLISWLIEAMRAPTPVSSLVHSSTLVAAGVWFFLRYGYLFNSCSLWLLFMSSLMTIVISGLCACSFMDLKKIVALSTCNNVSWCLLYFICGDVFLASCQLLTHGLCKCFLFMLVGDLMCSSGSSQSAVGVYPLSYYNFFAIFSQAVLIFSLAGLPFMGVFFSKHCFLSGFLFSSGLVSLMLVVIGFFLTNVYSFRLFWMLAGGVGGLSQSSISNFVLVGCLCLVGTFLNFFVGGLIEEVVVMSVGFSLIFLFVQVGGLLSGWVLYVEGCRGMINNLSYDVFGCNSLILIFYALYSLFSDFFYFIVFRWEASMVYGFFLCDFDFIRKFYGFSVNLGWLIFGVGFVVFTCAFFS